MHVAAPAPSDNALQDRLVADVTGAGTFTHLEVLQRIADENGGNRASPGPGYDASVDYVVGILRNAGYEASTPSFRVGNANARNGIAQTRTGNPERVVMAGAHLDSVPEGPGINDNGSGVAALLEIAERLGGSPPVSNAVRFAWWARRRPVRRVRRTTSRSSPRTTVIGCTFASRGCGPVGSRHVARRRPASADPPDDGRSMSCKTALRTRHRRLV